MISGATWTCRGTLRTGKVPANIIAIRNSLKNWERIRGGIANNLLKEVYKNSLDLRCKWTVMIKETLEKNGQLNLFQMNKDKKLSTHKIMDKLLSDQFHQYAFSTIVSENSKLRTYGLIKTQIGLEN